MDGFTFKEDRRVALEKGYDVHLLTCRQMIGCKNIGTQTPLEASRGDNYSGCEFWPFLVSLGG